MTERLARLRPDELSDGQQRLYDALTGGPRGAPGSGMEIRVDGSLGGPFNAMLHHPGVGAALQELGAQLRFAAVLTGRCRELAVLLVAAHHRSGYEWQAHAAIAQREGLTAGHVEAIRTGGRPDLDDEVERVTVAATRELLATGDLTDVSYRRAVDALGDAGLVELTALVGYYGLLALQMRVFRVPLPPGTSDPWAPG
jgi:4-carboxymuconolactone decarboxylase